MYSERCMDMSPNMAIPRPEMMGAPEAMAQGMGCCAAPMPAMECPPIVEPPVEKVCHRQIYHQVNRIQPVHTRIVNHHIYQHCTTPHFTCSEENVCCNVYGPMA